MKVLRNCVKISLRKWHKIFIHGTYSLHTLTQVIQNSFKNRINYKILTWENVLRCLKFNRIVDFLSLKATRPLENSFKWCRCEFKLKIVKWIDFSGLRWALHEPSSIIMSPIITLTLSISLPKVTNLRVFQLSSPSKNSEFHSDELMNGKNGLHQYIARKMLTLTSTRTHSNSMRPSYEWKCVIIYTFFFETRRLKLERMTSFSSFSHSL